MKSIISIKDLNKKDIEKIVKLSKKIKKNPEKFQNKLSGKIIASLFYEPSTRTRLSFESAVLRLGGKIISTENAKEFSSAKKGESLEDSIRVISNYADLIILRHFDDKALQKVVNFSKVPLINAGSGKKEHPTQALLDLYTIKEKFGRLDKLKIALVGDLKRGRTVKSLTKLLMRYPENQFYFVSPENSKMDEKIKEKLRKKKIPFWELNNLKEVVSWVDILYMTRIQKERFENEEEYLKAKGKNILTWDLVQKMSKKSIIMHPLPRLDEIPISIDKDKRAIYFKQAENGLWVRMALLVYLFKINGN